MSLFGKKGPPQEEDDLYCGYDEASPVGGRIMAYPTSDEFAPAPRTGFGRPPSGFRTPTAGHQAVPGTAMARGATPSGYGRRMGTGSRLGTASGNEENRPMTSNKGAGFSSAPRNPFDPLQQAAFGAGGQSPVLKPSEPSPEDQARDVEKKVHEMLEESARQAQLGDHAAALERAKEAGKKERQLYKLREQQGTSEQMNLDLTFAVVFNLAHAYVLNEMYSEALNAYGSIVKNKSFGQSGRLRVNMGNIYFNQRKYPTAIKMYRMALDQIPATSKEVRYKIMKNIGLAFIRMGQYSDAAQTLETVLNVLPDLQTGINLLVCYHALGDPEQMKKTFQRLLEAAPCQEDQDEEDEAVEDEHGTFRHDGLREELKQRQNEAARVILLASQLVAPQVDHDDRVAGFDWCIAQLNNAGHSQLASEVQLAKASLFLSSQDFKGAISIFKEFERKEHNLKARAATNLSFLYFLEGDPDSAKIYADLAVETDRYNALAWVNRGNIALHQNLIQDAQDNYSEALAAEADRFEAIYNLGLATKRLALQEENTQKRSVYFHESLKTFKKLHAQLPENLEVIYEVASIYELTQDTNNAIKWLEILHSLLPNDGRVSARLGAIFQALDDEARALHYYQEAHRAFPASMDVISWLGAFHVRNEVYEKAVPYFALAAKLQPFEVKWELMVASCHRRVQNYSAAFAKYKSIHSRHPENLECLRYLVHISTELGHGQEATEYATKLRRAERSQGPATMAPAPVYPSRPSNTPVAPEVPIPVGHMNAGHQDEHFRAQPASRPHSTGLKESGQVDDDWGNEDLGEDLLPI